MYRRNQLYYITCKTNSLIFLGWIKIEGKFQQIYSGPNCVLALAGNRDIYFRVNVFEKDGVSLSPNHEGTHWVRIEQPREEKIIFKQVNYEIKIIFYFKNR